VDWDLGFTTIQYYEQSEMPEGTHHIFDPEDDDGQPI
jgi:hypothetical protein